MLNKSQAAGVMDALIDPAEKERRRRLEKRQALMLALYPALRSAPIDERTPILRRARRYGFSRSSVYGALVFYLALVAALLGDQIFGVETEVPNAAAFPLVALAVLPALVLYLHIRSYTISAVAEYREKSSTS